MVWRFLFLAGLLTVLSWAVVQAGTYWGAEFVPAGDGIPQAADLAARNLFRADAGEYYSIARDGYAFDGDLYSSPNIVFAPTYPLLVTGLAPLFAGDTFLAGTLLNKALLFGAMVCWLMFLTPMLGRGRAFWVLAAATTAAGAYALHAFYSESTMLFFLGLCLLAWRKKWQWVLALSAGALGASRVAAMPMAALFAGAFAFQAWRSRHQAKDCARALIQAGVCVSGAGAYLGYVGMRFGNPFILFHDILAASWGAFHRPVDAWSLVTGAYLVRYWGMTLARGLTNWNDIRTLNLIWTTLGLAASVYLLVRWRRELWAWLFLVYFLLIYVTNTSSEFLISAHRYFLLMLPIFIMVAAGYERVARWMPPLVARGLAALLLAVNLAYGIFHAAYFNQGVWPYF